MCEPISMALMAGLSVAASVGGSIMSAGAQSASARAQAQIASNNATIATEQAADAKSTGAIQQQQLQQRIAATIGSGRAAWGGSGIQLGSGSPLDWEKSTAGEGAKDLAINQHNTDMRVWGYQAQATNLEGQSSAYSAAGDNALWSGGLSAGSSLLRGATMMSGEFGRAVPFSTGGYFSGGMY